MDGSMWTLLAVQLLAIAVLVHRLTDLGFLSSDLLHKYKLHPSQLLAPRQCGYFGTSKFALHSDHVVLPDGTRQAVVVVEDGKVVDVLPGTSAVEAVLKSWKISRDNVIDFNPYVISPGLVDVHVHLNEPGREDWEGITTGTRAAAAGGVTTVVDMPLNSFPTTTTALELQRKVALAKAKAHVTMGFWGGLVPENAHNASAMEELIQGGVLGFKAFRSPSGINDFANVDREDIVAALPILKQHGLPLLIHAEIVDDDHTPTGDSTVYTTYMNTRPREWEKSAINEIISILEETKDSPGQPGFRIHVVHLADADMLPRLQEAKDKGLPLTVETCPHYLNFAAEDVPDKDTRFKCAPPIRESENKKRLWHGLAQGIIDGISTDHSPAPPHLKLFDSGDFIKAWGGIAGLQYALPSTWHGMAEQGLSLDKLSHWWSEFPARLAGLQATKGSIAVGKDADFVVWDPSAVANTTEAGLYHKHKASPYAGLPLKGRVKATFVKGQLVFQDGKGVAPKPCGAAVLRRA